MWLFFITYSCQVEYNLICISFTCGVTLACRMPLQLPSTHLRCNPAHLQQFLLSARLATAVSPPVETIADQLNIISSEASNQFRGSCAPIKTCRTPLANNLCFLHADDGTQRPHPLCTHSKRPYLNLLLALI